MKGFTLIELIGIIIILGIIAILAVPSLLNVFEKQNESQYEQFLEDLYIVAENYIVVNEDKYSNLNSGEEVTIKEIIESGFITKDITNPETNKPIKDTDVIIITKTDGKYEFKFEER